MNIFEKNCNIYKKASSYKQKRVKKSKKEKTINHYFLEKNKKCHLYFLT